MEIDRLAWRIEDDLGPCSRTLIDVPRLKRLSLGSSQWESMCAALFSIRMTLDDLEEKQVVTLCRSSMESYGDFRSVYMNALVGFFGGSSHLKRLRSAKKATFPGKL